MGLADNAGHQREGPRQGGLIRKQNTTIDKVQGPRFKVQIPPWTLNLG